MRPLKAALITQNLMHMLSIILHTHIYSTYTRPCLPSIEGPLGSKIQDKTTSDMEYTLATPKKEKRVKHFTDFPKFGKLALQANPYSKLLYNIKLTNIEEKLDEELLIVFSNTVVYPVKQKIILKARSQIWAAKTTPMKKGCHKLFPHQHDTHG